MRRHPRLTTAALQSLPELRRLEHFRIACQARSLQEAALHCPVSQSTLSRSVQQLERTFDRPLVVRSRTGIELTRHGQALYQRLQLVHDALHSGQRAVHNARRSVMGQVRLAVPWTLSGILLPPLLERFGQHLSTTQLTILEGSGSSVQGWLRSGEADMGILAGFSGDRQIRSLRLLDDELLLVGRRPIPPGIGETLPFHRLAEHTRVLPLMPVGSRQALESMANDAGVRLRPAAEVDSPAIQKMMVRKLGFYIVSSRLSVQEELDSGAMFAVPIVPKPHRTFYLAMHRQLKLSPAARLLAHLVRRTADDLKAR